MVLQNVNRFSTQEYTFDRKVTNESRTVWIPINTQVREEYVYSVQITHLNLQDNYFQFSALTEDSMEIFTCKYEKTRPYEVQDNVQVMISWEFDLTLYRVDRDVYSLLDWIGDIGGLMEGFIVILSATFALTNFKKFEHFLIEQLYLNKD